jgi:hypothetical protein
MNSDISNAISVITFFAVGFGLLKLLDRFEPQWVSKDGLRFTAKMSLDNATTDKWTEVRVLVDGKEIFISARGRKAKALRGKWTLSYSADAQDARRRCFVIVRSSETNPKALLSVPATSRCVAVLDALTKAS